MCCKQIEINQWWKLAFKREKCRRKSGKLPGVLITYYENNFFPLQFHECDFMFIYIVV
jgi:hypothetical protein